MPSHRPNQTFFPLNRLGKDNNNLDSTKRERQRQVHPRSLATRLGKWRYRPALKGHKTRQHRLVRECHVWSRNAIVRCKGKRTPCPDRNPFPTWGGGHTREATSDVDVQKWTIPMGKRKKGISNSAGIMDYVIR